MSILDEKLNPITEEALKKLGFEKQPWGSPDYYSVESSDIRKRSYVKAEGTDDELLEDLTRIVNALIDKGGLTEEMIDIAVQIGKAISKGNEEETNED